MEKNFVGNLRAVTRDFLDQLETMTEDDFFGPKISINSFLRFFNERKLLTLDVYSLEQGELIYFGDCDLGDIPQEIGNKIIVSIDEPQEPYRIVVNV